MSSSLFDVSVNAWLGEGEVRLEAMNPALAGIDKGELIDRFGTDSVQPPIVGPGPNYRVAVIRYDLPAQELGMYAVLTSSREDNLDLSVRFTPEQAIPRYHRSGGVLRIGHLRIHPEGSSHPSMLGMVRLIRNPQEN